jgi:cell wall-associated NlpC family hydrolase
VAYRSLTGNHARRRRFSLPIFVAVLSGVASVALPNGIGSARPQSSLSIRQVQARVNALNTRAERITEAYDSANTKVAALSRQAQLSGTQLRRDQAALATVTRRVARGAAAAYKTGGLDPALTLVSSGSPQIFLDQASSLDEVARYDASQVAAARAAQRTVAGALVIHNAQVARAKAALRSVASARHQINALLSQQRQLLSRLKASERARLVAEARTAQRRDVAARTSYTPPPSYSGPASGRASVAVQFAYAQLGKPYVYGGAGPSSYDCSGLTMQAWGAAGVGLPHSAAGQQAMLPSVSLSALEPGDLVFYGAPAYHVAIYIGGGRIIQAPHTGAYVEISSLYDMPPTSAGRP